MFQPNPFRQPRPLVAPIVRPNGAWMIAAVIGGSLLIALTAQVSINLPFSPVPVTGQTFGVLLVGAAYGWRLGGATVVAYLGEGIAGMPVFSNGGSGWAWIEGPTGGYLLGFVAGAMVVGWLAERGWDRHPFTTAAAMVLGNIVIYIAGVWGLQRFTGWDRVWDLGVEPFIAGDIVKILLAAGVLPGAWWLRRALGGSLGGRELPPGGH